MRLLTIGLICALLARLGETIHDDSLPGIYLSMNLMQKPGVAIDNRRARRLQEDRRTRRLQENGYNDSSTETIPLFQGMGTHYSYIYVGT